MPNPTQTMLSRPSTYLVNHNMHKRSTPHVLGALLRCPTQWPRTILRTSLPLMLMI